MSKKSRERRERAAHPERRQRTQAEIPFVERPFEGLPVEVELVGLRDILPMATLPARTTSQFGSRDLLLTTTLPGMNAALYRKDGILLIATQMITKSGDASRDIASSIEHGIELKPESSWAPDGLPEPGLRLQDILDPEGFGDLKIWETPEYWMTDDELADPNTTELLNQARDEVPPMAEIDGIRGAYWTRMGSEFLRWVRPEPRDAVLDGVARLRAAAEADFEGGRFIGVFRSLGLAIPVWELDRGTEADELPAPLAQFQSHLQEAIASTAPLTPEQKRARAGVVSRQVVLR